MENLMEKLINYNDYINIIHMKRENSKIDIFP